MALFKFTSAIIAGEPIKVFNNGRHRRDFTYIDDIVEGVRRVIDRPAKADSSWSGDSPCPGTSAAPWRLYNIGNNEPIELMDFIQVLEQTIGRKAQIEMLPLQPVDIARYLCRHKRSFGGNRFQARYANSAWNQQFCELV